MNEEEQIQMAIRNSLSTNGTFEYLPMIDNRDPDSYLNSAPASPETSCAMSLMSEVTSVDVNTDIEDWEPEAEDANALDNQEVDVDATSDSHEVPIATEILPCATAPKATDADTPDSNAAVQVPVVSDFEPLPVIENMLVSTLDLNANDQSEAHPAQNAPESTPASSMLINNNSDDEYTHIDFNLPWGETESVVWKTTTTMRVMIQYLKERFPILNIRKVFFTLKMSAVKRNLSKLPLNYTLKRARLQPFASIDIIFDKDFFSN